MKHVVVTVTEDLGGFRLDHGGLWPFEVEEITEHLVAAGYISEGNRLFKLAEFEDFERLADVLERIGYSTRSRYRRLH